MEYQEHHGGCLSSIFTSTFILVFRSRKNLSTKKGSEEEFISIGGKTEKGPRGSLDLASLQPGITEDDCYLKEDEGVTVQNRQSNKTSLDDISGAALASYEPKLGKKKMK